MKKKVLLFILMLLAGVLLVPSTQVKAMTDGELLTKYRSSIQEVFGNGGDVVINDIPQEMIERLESYQESNIKGAYITVTDANGNVTEYVTTRGVTVYGGKDNDSVKNTNITINGGTVKNVFAGGKGANGFVSGKAKITINGGNVGYKENYSNLDRGGYVYGGGDGANVNESEIIVNKSSYDAITKAIVGTGNDGTHTEKSTIIVNGGAPIVANAIGTARLGTGKIVINGGGATRVYNGYYWPVGTNQSYEIVDSLELEIWGGYGINVITTGVHGKAGAGLIPAKQITKFSYDRRVTFVAYPYPSTFGSILDEDTAEIIPYITLNVKVGDFVATKELVPAKFGVVDKETAKKLRKEVLEKAELTDDDVEDKLYSDEALTERYVYSDAIAEDRNVKEVTIYLKEKPQYTFKLVYGDNIEVSRLFRENHVITSEEYTAIFDELREKAELAENAEIECYFDEDMSEEVTEEFGPMTEDITLYANVTQFRVDDSEDDAGDGNSGEGLEEIPNTADINLIAILGAITVGGLGLGYTIKKRKFN